MAGSGDQQYCLRWNSHLSTLQNVFDQLLTCNAFVDVTLAADGQTIGAHKVILSACSPYFQQILMQLGDKHPVLLLKDVKFEDLKCLIDYMYRGEVNVSPNQLESLIKVAESLRIRGLADNLDSSQVPTSAPASYERHQSTPRSLLGSSAPSKRTHQDSESFRENPKVSLPVRESSAAEASTSYDDASDLDKVKDMLKKIPATVTPVGAVSDSSEPENDTLSVKEVPRGLDKVKPEPDEGSSDGFWQEDSNSGTSPDYNSFANSGLCEQDEGFQCPKCGRKYSVKGSLMRHVRYECGIAPQFACEGCHRKFQHNFNLLNHARSCPQFQLLLKRKSLQESSLASLS